VRLRNTKQRCEGGCCRHPAWAYDIRRAVAGDVGWILRSWLESYHDNGLDTRGARLSEYRPMMQMRMARLIPRSVVMVACDPDEPDHLWGFVVAERRGDMPIVHFAYVKQTRREHGLAALLVRRVFSELGFPEPPTEWHFTHGTQLFAAIAKRAGHGGRHNASAAWAEEPSGEVSLKGTG
jgi:hypothetical protein